jgi:membrane-associated phospholipid phosphatase
MQDKRGIDAGAFVRAGFGDGFAVPVVLLGIFGLLIARGIWLLPEGYNGANGLNATLLFVLLVWSLGMIGRCAQPGSRIASGIVTAALFAAVSFCAALAAASSAIGGGDYIDPWLVAIDQTLFPFYDWKAVATTLPDYPRLYWILNKSYNSLSWQPMLFILITIGVGQVRDLSVFITAWSLGLLGCILPFHWLPALSPLPYYGISQSDLPGHLTALPWRFVPVIEGMRDGTIRALDVECLTGMVTIPSFHACGATILLWAYWRYRLLRWPFVILNVLMALAAVPIGSHYIIDIIVGVAVGVLAAMGAQVLTQRSPLSLRFTTRRQADLQPV